MERGNRKPGESARIMRSARFNVRAGSNGFQLAGLYVLLNPFRAFVIVYDPSCSATSLIQCAAPLCAGAGVAPAPGCGAGVGATGISEGAASAMFAMNIPGTVYSWPLRSEKCI